MEEKRVEEKGVEEKGVEEKGVEEKGVEEQRVSVVYGIEPRNIDSYTWTKTNNARFYRPKHTRLCLPPVLPDL